MAAAISSQTTVWRNARKRVRKANPTVEKSNRKYNVDFVLENHFSIFLLRPRSASAEAWVLENIGPGNGFQPYFPTIVIESGYVGPILDGIRESGLILRGQ